MPIGITDFFSTDFAINFASASTFNFVEYLVTSYLGRHPVYRSWSLVNKKCNNISRVWWNDLIGEKKDKRRTFGQCYLCERHSKILVFIVTLLLFSVIIEWNYLILIYLVIFMSETIDHEIETLTLEFILFQNLFSEWLFIFWSLDWCIVQLV